MCWNELPAIYHAGLRGAAFHRVTIAYSTVGYSANTAAQYPQYCTAVSIYCTVIAQSRSDVSHRHPENDVRNRQHSAALHFVLLLHFHAM
jgi:hypothetical protein